MATAERTMGTTHRAAELAALLGRRRRAIRSSWSTLMRQLPDSHYQARSADELAAWTGQSIAAIVESLETGSPQPLVAHADKVSRVRAGLEFEIQEVVQGLLLLKEAALGEIVDTYADDPDRLRQVCLVLDQSLRTLIACFASNFAELMQQSVRNEQERTRLLLKVAEAAGSSLDLGQVLLTVADSVRRTLDGSHCSIYLWSESEAAFSSQARAGQIEDDALRDAVARRLTPETDPLIAEALSIRGPVAGPCSGENRLLGEDLCAAGITAAVVLPIQLAEEVLALALVLLERPLGDSGEGQIELARAIVASVAPAVDNARRHSKAREELAASRRLERVTTSFLDIHDLREGLELISREIRDLTQARGVSIYLRNGADEPRCAHTDGATVAEGPEQRQLALAMHHKEHDLGRILLIDLPSGVDPAEARFLQLFADHAAAAIEHASYHEQKEELAALEERQTLAHELHDSVTQSLYGVTMFAEAAARLQEEGDHSKAEVLLQQLRDTSLDALREMRLLLFDLRPPVLAEHGLVQALQTRLAAVEERASVQTELTTEGVESLPPEVEEGLYGICTEALNNSLKHAKATRISVRLVGRGPAVSLEVVDDGQGFDPAGARDAGGMGVAGMEERAARLGARFSLASRPGEGTRVRVDVPLEVSPDRQGQLEGGAT